MIELTWGVIVYRSRRGDGLRLSPSWGEWPTDAPQLGAIWIGQVIEHDLVVQGFDVETVKKNLRAIVPADIQWAARHGVDKLTNPRPAPSDMREEFERGTEIDRLVVEVPTRARITLVVRKTERCLTWAPRPE